MNYKSNKNNLLLQRPYAQQHHRGGQGCVPRSSITRDFVSVNCFLKYATRCYVFLVFPIYLMCQPSHTDPVSALTIPHNLYLDDRITCILIISGNSLTINSEFYQKDFLEIWDLLEICKSFNSSTSYSLILLSSVGKFLHLKLHSYKCWYFL